MSLKKQAKKSKVDDVLEVSAIYTFIIFWVALSIMWWQRLRG